MLSGSKCVRLTCASILRTLRMYGVPWVRFHRNYESILTRLENLVRVDRPYIARQGHTVEPKGA